jgi:hypothetical protein
MRRRRWWWWWLKVKDHTNHGGLPLMCMVANPTRFFLQLDQMALWQRQKWLMRLHLAILGAWEGCLISTPAQRLLGLFQVALAHLIQFSINQARPIK